MITVRQMLKNISPGYSVSGYRTILLQKYEEYRRKTKKKLITVSYKLPYETKEEINGFFVHWKILSENLNKHEVYYDVIINFMTDNKIVPDTQIKVYCNSHQFIYTYAYCYNKSKDLLFTHLYPSIVLREKPKIKNPSCQLGMDKHIYVALKESISNRITYDKVPKYNKEKWGLVPTFDEVNNKVNNILKSQKRLSKKRK